MHPAHAVTALKLASLRASAPARAFDFEVLARSVLSRAAALRGAPVRAIPA
jgi:hypothetical protein